MGSLKREPLNWFVTDFDGILSYEGLNIFAIFFLAHVACIHSFHLKKKIMRFRLSNEELYWVTGFFKRIHRQRHVVVYVVVTTQGKLPVSWPIICCPKLQKHIECTRDISFWFLCMWQLEPIIVWCFAWSHYRENYYFQKINPYFGAFFSLTREQANIATFRLTIF